MKNVLVINYSQSGQLDQILENFLIPFKTFNIEWVKISPQKDFPFPWTSEVFFDIMPETVLEEPIELTPYSLQKEKYDLIIIGYQPWFLSPSLPITGLLKDPQFLSVLNNTPVATVIGARNMWLKSQESVVKWIEDAGGRLVANIPFIDKVQNHISALTILHWMSTGKKTRRWGFLPLPGVSERDINEAHIFGKFLAKALENEEFSGVQKQIIDIGGIRLKSSIMLVEERGKKIFSIWANTIKKKSNNPEKRAKLIKVFEWYLITALFIISPPILIIHTLLKPFLWSKIKRNKNHYLYLGINH